MFCNPLPVEGVYFPPIIFRTPDDLTPGPYKVEMRAIFGKDKMRIGVLGTILQVE